MKAAFLFLRTHKKLIMLTVLIFTFTMTSCQPAQASQRVEEVHTDGITVWLIRDTSLPIVAIQMTVARSGSVFDPALKQGLSYLTARLMTEGTQGKTSTQFHEMLDLYAIDLTVGSGRDDMTISVESLSEHTENAFNLLGEMLIKPRFDREDINRIVTEHVSDLKQLQESPDYRLNDAFYRSAFAGHAYANSPYGTAASVTVLTQEDVKTFAASHVAKDRLILSVSGDIDAKTLKRYIHAHLSNLPNKATLLPSPEHVALHTQHESKQVNMVVPQTSIRIALQGIARNDKDFYAAYVMNYMLGGGSMSSRLGEAIRKKRGFTYSVASELSMSDYAEWVSVDFATKKTSVTDALKVALETLQDAADNGFTEEELIAAKDYLTGAFPLATDSNNERVNYLTVMQQYGLGVNYLEERNTLLTSLTLQHINDVAKRLLSINNRLVILTGETL